MTELERVFIEHISTSGYRPEANAKLERGNIMITEFIKQYVDKYDNWDSILAFAAFNINISNSEATGFSPIRITI